MKYPEVNIGEQIKGKMQEMGLNKARLARMLETSNQNITHMLGKPSLDTAKLARVSVALDYDFFQSYRPEGVPQEGVNEVLQERVSSLEKLIEEKQKLIDEKQKLIEEKERTISILMGAK